MQYPVAPMERFFASPFLSHWYDASISAARPASVSACNAA